MVATSWSEVRCPYCHAGFIRKMEHRYCSARCRSLSRSERSRAMAVLTGKREAETLAERQRQVELARLIEEQTRDDRQRSVGNTSRVRLDQPLPSGDPRYAITLPPSDDA